LLTTRGFSKLQYKKVGELFPQKVAKLVEFTIPKKLKIKKNPKFPHFFAEKPQKISSNIYIYILKKTLYL